MKQFLGLAGFYRSFIKVVINWDSRAEEAFIKLKTQLASDPVLAFPRLGEPFIVEVDGSDYAVGGVLSQKDKDGFLHPDQFCCVELVISHERSFRTTFSL